MAFLNGAISGADHHSVCTAHAKRNRITTPGLNLGTQPSLSLQGRNEGGMEGVCGFSLGQITPGCWCVWCPDVPCYSMRLVIRTTAAHSTSQAGLGQASEGWARVDLCESPTKHRLYLEATILVFKPSDDTFHKQNSMSWDEGRRLPGTTSHCL